MPRVRVCTSADEQLLAQARQLSPGTTGAALLDAFVRAHRSAEIDAVYNAYDDHPLDGPDVWCDLASFREAAGRS